METPNDILARRRHEADVSRPASIVPDDPKTRAFVAELEAQRMREAATAILDRTDILRTFQARDFEDDVFAALHYLNGPTLQHMVQPGRSREHDRIVTTMERYTLNFWRERFDLVATRLGYTKAR